MGIDPDAVVELDALKTRVASLEAGLSAAVSDHADLAVRVDDNAAAIDALVNGGGAPPPPPPPPVGLPELRRALPFNPLEPPASVHVVTAPANGSVDLPAGVDCLVRFDQLLDNNPRIIGGRDVIVWHPEVDIDSKSLSKGERMGLKVGQMRDLYLVGGHFYGDALWEGFQIAGAIRRFVAQINRVDRIIGPYQVPGPGDNHSDIIQPHSFAPGDKIDEIFIDRLTVPEIFTGHFSMIGPGVPVDLMEIHDSDIFAPNMAVNRAAEIAGAERLMFLGGVKHLLIGARVVVSPNSQHDGGAVWAGVMPGQVTGNWILTTADAPSDGWRVTAEMVGLTRP